MTTINLYQNQEQQEKLSQRTANGGFFFSLSILVVTVLALVGLKVASSFMTKENLALDDQVKQQSEGLKGVSNLQKILDLQTRLAKIKSNLKIDDNGNIKVVSMTDVLDKLSSELSSGVVVKSYSYTDSGKIKLTIAVTNFADAARQILNFKKSANFKNANLDNINRGEKNIMADISLELK